MSAVDITRKDVPEAEPRGGGGVRLGVRFELFDPTNQNCLGAIIREDLVGAAAPHAGEHFGRSTFGSIVHNLVGFDTEIHHVDHYVQVPGTRDWSPLVMAIVRVNHVSISEVRRAESSLKDAGWSVTIFDEAAV